NIGSPVSSCPVSGFSPQARSLANKNSFFRFLASNEYSDAASTVDATNLFMAYMFFSIMVLSAFGGGKVVGLHAPVKEKNAGQLCKGISRRDHRAISTWIPRSGISGSWKNRISHWSQKPD